MEADPTTGYDFGDKLDDTAPFEYDLEEDIFAVDYDDDDNGASERIDEDFFDDFSDNDSNNNNIVNHNIDESLEDLEFESSLELARTVLALDLGYHIEHGALLTAGKDGDDYEEESEQRGHFTGSGKLKGSIFFLLNLLTLKTVLF